jgi:hypothetical protein
LAALVVVDALVNQSLTLESVARFQDQAMDLEKVDVGYRPLTVLLPRHWELASGRFLCDPVYQAVVAAHWVGWALEQVSTAVQMPMDDATPVEPWTCVVPERRLLWLSTWWWCLLLVPLEELPSMPIAVMRHRS